MAKNTDSSIKLLVLYDILLKSTDEEHALSTNEIIEELKKRGISVSRKVLPSDIDLLNKYGYEICSYVKKSRYYYAVHQLFDTAEITMLADVIKASKLTQSRKETIINKLYSTIGLYRDTATDNIIFLDAKKFGNSSIIYNIDAIETAIKQKKKVSFVYFHLDENKNKVYHKGTVIFPVVSSPQIYVIIPSVTAGFYSFFKIIETTHFEKSTKNFIFFVVIQNA